MAEFDGAPIARRQGLVLALPPAMPNRTDGMDHMPRREQVTFGDLGVAGLAAVQCLAFGEQSGSSSVMDRSIDAASPEQRRVRGVDDGVNAERGDIGNDDFQPRRTELACSQIQAVAAALIATPLSARSCCNSPAWNISRMMSQPPTNSPFT